MFTFPDVPLNDSAPPYLPAAVQVAPGADQGPVVAVARGVADGRAGALVEAPGSDQAGRQRGAVEGRRVALRRSPAR